MVRLVTRQTGLRKLCLAGGVAMNCVANGKLLSKQIVDDIYTPPCALDAGTALGAAWLAWLKTGRPLQRQVLQTALLGPEYTEAEIDAAIRAGHLQAEAVEDPAGRAAELLSQGKVVAWFQGRMEFGQRALGGRSILADPRRAEMKEIINAKVKFREPFRPFAPSVLEERANDFFHADRPAPFMTEVYAVRAEKRPVIPAVTHVDGTARLQTVSKSVNPLYWQLIWKFGELTGVPVVLNTSFNVLGEPIVTPRRSGGNLPQDRPGCVDLREQAGGQESDPLSRTLGLEWTRELTRTPSPRPSPHRMGAQSGTAPPLSAPQLATCYPHDAGTPHPPRLAPDPHRRLPVDDGVIYRESPVRLRRGQGVATDSLDGPACSRRHH